MKSYKDNIGIIHKDCADARRKDWQKRNEHTIIEVGDSAKASFTDGRFTEHMWARVEKIERDTIIGTLDSYPMMIRKYNFGDTVRFKIDEIEDLIKKGDISRNE